MIIIIITWFTLTFYMMHLQYIVHQNPDFNFISLSVEMKMISSSIVVLRYCDFFTVWIGLNDSLVSVKADYLSLSVFNFFSNYCPSYWSRRLCPKQGRNGALFSREVWGYAPRKFWILNALNCRLTVLGIKNELEVSKHELEALIWHCI